MCTILCQVSLATELLSDIRPAPTRAPTFSSRARPVWNTPSGLDVKILGELPPGPSSPERPERVLLVGTREVENPSRDGELLAFGSSDPSQPLWRRPLGGEAVSVGWREDLHLFGAGYADSE